MILFDDTIRQQASDGTASCEILAGQDVIPGIKIDKGTIPLAFPGDKVTEEVVPLPVEPRWRSS